MNIEFIFKDKEEIDAWFNTSLEGLSKAMASEAYKSINSQTSGEYNLLLFGLNKARERLYQKYGITPLPPRVTIQDIVGPAILIKGDGDPKLN